MKDRASCRARYTALGPTASGSTRWCQSPWAPGYGGRALAFQASGAKHVHRYIVIPHLIGQEKTEHVQRRFAGAIDDAASLLVVVAHPGTDVYDAAPALFHHRGQDGPAYQKGPSHVCCENLVPERWRDLQYGMAQGHRTGVVHQHIDTAVPVDYLPDHI